MTRTKLLVALGAMLMAPLTVQAEEPDAAKAYMAAMHESMSMNMEMSGDPDVDFVKLMIPHHQGAVDMAKIVLKYGKDPEIRKMAEDVISAQEEEIAWMKKWLETHGGN